LTTGGERATLPLLLLILTTIRRLALLLFVLGVWTSTAYAWSWPVQGQVLQPFSYDEAHPYAAGQHRGIDIAADATGETVVAPAAGTVSFAGFVPNNGKSVTIETADGYSVTLTHLGTIAVAKGATVAEQAVVGTIGPSGTPEQSEPYVHLGIRHTADPNGYVDPLGLLPPAPGDGPTDGGSTGSQPVSSGATSGAPKSKPARPTPQSPRATTARAAQAEPVRSDVRVHQQQSAQKPRTELRTSRSEHRTEQRPTVRDRVDEPTSAFRRPGVEPAAHEPLGLDAGHAVRPTLPAARSLREPSSPWLELLCNGAAAVFALGAALAVRGRRRCVRTIPVTAARVHRLPPLAVEHRRFSRAA
jgi:murein DD-endopeptidase MepM/ murein hydrolase activator NlpD